MARRGKLDPRAMMEKAIDVMRSSIRERRDDDKHQPVVGAVLVKSDGSIDTAFRGEFREGDHAEYTLIDKKNRATSLDGSHLFATLEPCAPGARSFPKLGCAERIVNARIAKVWVGIEDPDPNVDRKGIQFLQNHNVEVAMFDRDLQEQIRSDNREFIAQALERRAETDDVQPAHSEFEDPLPGATFADLSLDALEEYRRMAGLPGPVSSEDFQHQLRLSGLLVEGNGSWVPSRYAVILFGSNPRDPLPQAGLLATVHMPDGREEIRDFEGPQVLAPVEALRWLRDKLPNPIERSAARRVGANDVFFEIAREGIVNALVHRDYGIVGAKCQLVAHADRIEIRSPGAPVSPITIEQLRSFSAPMLSRNPIMHYVFSRMELAEERGLGLKSMRDKATSAGLPLPTLEWEEPYVRCTVFASALATLPDALREELGKAELSAWAWMATRQSLTAKEYRQEIGVPGRTALNHLKRFAELGLVRKVGAGPATRYEIVRP